MTQRVDTVLQDLGAGPQPRNPPVAPPPVAPQAAPPQAAPPAAMGADPTVLFRAAQMRAQQQSPMSLLIAAGLPAPEGIPQEAPDTPGIFGELGRGIGRGAVDLATSTPLYLAATAATAVGHPEVANDLVSLGLEWDRWGMEKFPPSVSPSFTEMLEEDRSVGEWARFVALHTGEQVPNVLATLTGIGAGAAVGRQVATMQAKKMIAPEVGKQLVMKYGSRGALAGAAVVQGGLEGAGVAREQMEAVGEISPGVVLTAGAVSGALGSVVPVYLAGKLGIGPQLASSLLGRIEGQIAQKVGGAIGTLGVAAGGEFTTEALQEMVAIAARSFVDEEYDALGPEAAGRVIDAAVVGGLMGTIFGVGPAIAGQRGPAEQAQQEIAGLLPQPVLITPPPGSPGLLPVEGQAPPPVQGVETTPSSDPLQGYTRIDHPAIIISRAQYGTQSLNDDGTMTVELPEGPQSLGTTQSVELIGGLTEGISPVELANMGELEFITSEISKQAEILKRPRMDMLEPARGVRPGTLVMMVEAGTENRPMAGATLLRPEEVDRRQAAGFKGRMLSVDVSQLPIKSVNARLDFINDRAVSAAQGTPRQIRALKDALALRDQGRVEEARDRYRNLLIRGLYVPPPVNIFAFDEQGVEVAGPIPMTALKELLFVPQPAGESIRSGEVEFDPVNRVRRTLEPSLAFDVAHLEIVTMGKSLDKAFEISGPNVDFWQTKLTNAAKHSEARFRSVYGNFLQKGGSLRYNSRGVEAGDVAVPFEGTTSRVGISPSAVPPAHLDPASRMLTRPGGVQWMLERGKVIAGPSVLEEGQVTAVVEEGGPPEALKLFRKAVKFYEKMTRDFHLTRPLLIRFRESNTANYVFSKADNAHIITIPHSMLEAYGERRAPATIAHEFGHVLEWEYWYDVGPDVQSAIYSAWRQARLRAGQAENTIQAASNFLTPELVQNFHVQDTDTQNPVLRRKAFDEWFNFHEFFAEEFVKFANSDREIVTLMDQIFDKLYRAYRRLSAEAAKLFGITDVEPTEIMQQLFETMRQGGLERTMPEPHFLSANIEASRNSQIENAELLDLAFNDPTVPPRQPETFGMRNIFSRFPNIFPNGRRWAAEADRYNWMIKWGYGILQLAQINRHIPQLQRYVELIDEWNAFKMKEISRADQRSKEWWNLGKEQAKAVGDMLFELDALDAWPDDAEFAAMVRRHKLNDRAAELVMDIQADFSNFLDLIEATLIENIRRSSLDPTRADAEIEGVREEFERMREKPYFPLLRYGSYTTDVRDSAGEILAFHTYESEIERRKALGTLQREHPGANFVFGRLSEEAQMYQGMPPTLLKHIMENMDLDHAQRQELNQLLISLAPANSFRHRMSRRDRTPGFSRDAMRAYGHYFLHGANHLGKIKYGEQMAETVQGLEQQTHEAHRQGVDRDLTKRYGIIDMMKHHHKYILNPGNEWAGLRAFGFLWQLGFAVDSAFVNLTQIPMVAWPYLATRFGDAKAAAQLSKGFGKIRQLYRMAPGDLPDAEIAAIKRGVEQGFLEEGMATELAALAEGSTLQRLTPGTRAERALKEASYYAAFLFQHAEKLNRRVTFRAAYALAQEGIPDDYRRELLATYRTEYTDLTEFNHWTSRDALAYLAGKDSVRRSMFEYSQFARPRFMQGKKSALFLFYTFVQNMLFFTAHSPGRMRHVLVLLALSGLMGLPGAGDMNELIKLLARMLPGNLRFDPEKEMREFLVDLGSEYPDLWLNGSGRYGMGLGIAAQAAGIPFPNFDLSQRLSMGHVVPGFRELGSALSPEQDFDRGFTTQAEDVMGAVFSIPLQLGKALADNHPDFYKRWERTMPRALRNVVKAQRFAAEGRERTRTGATVLEFDANDPIDMAEIIGQGLGFSPTELRQTWDRDIAVQEATRYWTTRRAMALANLDFARMIGDREAMADARKALRRFNDEVPSGLMKITGETLKESLLTRERNRRLQSAGVAQQRSLQPIVRGMQETYPEVTKVR